PRTVLVAERPSAGEGFGAPVALSAPGVRVPHWITPVVSLGDARALVAWVEGVLHATTHDRAALAVSRAGGPWAAPVVRGLRAPERPGEPPAPPGAALPIALTARPGPVSASTIWLPSTQGSDHRVLDGPARELRAPAHAGLLADARQAVLHRAHREVDQFADLAVGALLRQQPQDLLLAVGQQRADADRLALRDARVRARQRSEERRVG